VILIIAAQIVAGGLVSEDASETSISIKIIITLVYSVIAIGGALNNGWE
jgi:hypothetical protein